MKAYKIHLIRHAMTEENLDGKYIGQTDVPASEYGLRQIKDIIDEYGGYPEVDAVVSSPLKRCTETAKLIYPGKEPMILNGLIEYDFGEFEGKTPDELKDREDYKKFLEGGLDNPPPGGESVREVVGRCYDALSVIIGDMMEEGLTNCAVITHSGIIMNMLACFGLPKRRAIEYACGFGEGFEVMVSASMWQRSGAFEIIDTFPHSEEPFEDDYADDSDDGEHDHADEDEHDCDCGCHHEHEQG